MSDDTKRVMTIYPTPSAWVRIHRALTREFKQRADIKIAPPTPLILGGWVMTSERDKKERWEATLAWVEANKCEHLIPVLDAEQLVSSATVSEKVGDYGFGDPIFDAAQGDIDSLRECIARGADVNLRDDSGDSPLIIAARNDFVEGVKLLVGNGADLARDGLAALDAAIPIQGRFTIANQEISRFLLESGVSPTGSGLDWTPLHSASSNASDTSLLRLLLSFTPDVNIATSSGHTPLMAAAASGATENIRLLVKKGADIGALDLEGKDAFEWAHINNHSEICALIDELKDTG